MIVLVNYFHSYQLTELCLYQKTIWLELVNDISPLFISKLQISFQKKEILYCDVTLQEICFLGPFVKREGNDQGNNSPIFEWTPL